MFFTTVSSVPGISQVWTNICWKNEWTCGFVSCYPPAECYRGFWGCLFPGTPSPGDGLGFATVVIWAIVMQNREGEGKCMIGQGRGCLSLEVGEGVAGAAEEWEKRGWGYSWAHELPCDIWVMLITNLSYFQIKVWLVDVFINSNILSLDLAAKLPKDQS